MRLIRDFIVSHPWNSALLISLLLLAGLADGLGLSAMLPMLNLAFDPGASGEPSDNLSAMIYRIIESVGITPSIGVLLALIVAGITIKNTMMRP